MKKQSSKQHSTNFQLLIKTLENMGIVTPAEIKDIDYNHYKKSLTITYKNGQRRGYIGNIAIKVMAILKKLEK